MEGERRQRHRIIERGHLSREKTRRKIQEQRGGGCLFPLGLLATQRFAGGWEGLKVEGTFKEASWWGTRSPGQGERRGDGREPKAQGLEFSLRAAEHTQACIFTLVLSLSCSFFFFFFFVNDCLWAVLLSLFSPPPPARRVSHLQDQDQDIYTHAHIHTRTLI